jgi:ATP-binding cassette subfamily B protein
MSAPLPPRTRAALAGVAGLLPLWRFLRPHRWRVAAAGLSLLGAALTTLLMPLALRSLIDHGFIGSSLTSEPGTQVMALRGHFVTLALCGAALGLCSAARFFSVAWLAERVALDLQRAVYHHALRQSPAYFERTPASAVLSAITADTTLIQTVLGSSLGLGVRNALLVLGSLALLVWTAPWVMAQVLGLLIVVVLPALAVERFINRLARVAQDRLAASTGVASEVLRGLTVVQSYAQERFEAGRYRAAVEHALQAMTRYIGARTPLMAFSICAIFASLLWGLYQGMHEVMQGRMSAGTFGQTVLYIIVLIGGVSGLTDVWGELLRASVATQRLMALLAARSSIESSIEPPAAQPLPATSGGARVTLRNVTFSYPARPQQPTLHEFNLDVRPGETVALVGPSGAGKSTVFQLLLRYFDVQSGGVLVDGVDVREANLSALRQRIALVPQDSVVFSASALDNIRYGRPGASDAEVIAAATAAHADGFIRALPQGYDTYLGERGIGLSGGQRQRLCIARAILKNAPLLLLDEATSALDTASERAVQAALDSAMHGRTTLVIAHRLSTVVHANRIAVLDHGRLVDVGPHAELMQRCALYASLAQAQFGARAA